jgi:8-amino-7-oxononanoate synthase
MVTETENRVFDLAQRARPDDGSRYEGIERLRRAGLWDQVIDEVDGRRIRIGSHWYVDFASCNYLGFDLEPAVADAIDATVRRWGSHPSWSRMLGSPRPYATIEERLAELLGAPDVLALPTISQIHLSAIPVLAGSGAHIFLDSRAHRTIYDGCVHARGLGATVQRFRSADADHLEQLLRGTPAGGSRLVCMDGINSMTGNPPDLAAFVRVCREYGALLYVDDAHGFGVIGERRPDETSRYGARGNAVVRHFGESYDGVVLVAGLSKAYSSLLAFVAGTPDITQLLKVAAATYLFSGPTSTASLASVLAGLDINAERGDAIRADVHAKTARILDHLRTLNVATPNTSGFPLVEIPLRDPEDLLYVGESLLERGIYTTLAPYPGVPREHIGFRLQVTAANTDEQVDTVLEALSWLADPAAHGRVLLRPAVTA